MRGACDGDGDEDGDRYRGSSWSGARGSSKESRNLEGDIEPSTEFSNDMVKGEYVEMAQLQESRAIGAREAWWNVVQVSCLRTVGT